MGCHYNTKDKMCFKLLNWNICKYFQRYNKNNKKTASHWKHSYILES